MAGNFSSQCPRSFSPQRAASPEERIMKTHLPVVLQQSIFLSSLLQIQLQLIKIETHRRKECPCLWEDSSAGVNIIVLGARLWISSHGRCSIVSALATDSPGALVSANLSLGLRPWLCVLFYDKHAGEVTGHRVLQLLSNTKDSAISLKGKEKL